MSDLVQRLRDLWGSEDLASLYQATDEAADELSRLRAELEEATTSLRLSRGGFAHCAAENQMLRAELDEALKVVRAAEEWNAADPRLAVVYAASHALATAVAQWASTHAAAHSAPDGATTTEAGKA